MDTRLHSSKADSDSSLGAGPVIAPTRYGEIEVRGSAREMGRQIGEAARDQVRGFSAVALERVRRTVRVTSEQAARIAHDSVSRARDYAPHMVEELEGVAESSGVSLQDLMLLQVRNQLHAANRSGCTSFAVAPEANAAGASIAAQNWDNDPAWDPFTVVLTRRPDNAPDFMSVTQAGLVAYIGLNDRGIGCCLNTLPAPSRAEGVPHYFTLRGIYEAESLDGAVHAVDRAERAIPASIMMTTPQGPANLEVTLDGVRVLTDDDGDGVITHTNHCLHPDLLAINDDFPELIESRPRKARVDRLLTEAGRPVTIEAMKAVLADHDRHPRSICRHPNDDPGVGEWRTVLSVIIEADRGRMHLTRGNPCELPFETYAFN